MHLTLYMHSSLWCTWYSCSCFTPKILKKKMQPNVCIYSVWFGENCFIQPFWCSIFWQWCWIINELIYCIMYIKLEIKESWKTEQIWTVTKMVNLIWKTFRKILKWFVYCRLFYVTLSYLYWLYCILYKYIIYMWQTGGYTQGALSGVSHGYEHALLVRRRSASLQNIKMFFLHILYTGKYSSLFIFAPVVTGWI